MAKEEEEGSGFRVTDRRLFRERGEPNQAPEGEKPAAPPPAAEPPRAAAPPEPSGPEPEAHPPIDFGSYVWSYYAQALVLLGEVPDPSTNAVEQDLEAARQVLDLLGMLQEKTRGNLTPEEARVLDQVLYELRMKFMARTQRIRL